MLMIADDFNNLFGFYIFSIEERGIEKKFSFFKVITVLDAKDYE